MYRPPATAAAWLLDPGSVTQSLTEQFGAVRVDVLEQSWGYPSLNESRAVGIAPRRLAIVRRVALRAGGDVRVLARTIMPEAALQNRFRHLGRMGSRPLGHALFTDPAIRRLGWQIARLPPHHFLFPELPRMAWGRRSLFALGSGRILVYEVFLPNLYDNLYDDA